MSTSSRNTSKPTAHKVGDVILIPNAPAAMVRLPDGSVVTTRGTYTVRHEGDHAIVTVAKDGALAETPFKATAAKGSRA